MTQNTSSPQFCAHCGAPLPPDALFCCRCAAPVTPSEKKSTAAAQTVENRQPAAQTAANGADNANGTNPADGAASAGTAAEKSSAPAAQTAAAQTAAAQNTPAEAAAKPAFGSAAAENASEKSAAAEKPAAVLNAEAWRVLSPAGADSSSEGAEYNAFAGAASVGGVKAMPGKPFAADMRDLAAAVGFIVLGLLYFRWVWWNPVFEGHMTVFGAQAPLFAPLGVFAALYAGAVLAYTAACRRSIPRGSWFWLGVLACQTTALVLWGEDSYTAMLNFLMLHFTAIYWTMAATGTLAEGKTGTLLFFDLLNGQYVIPYSNFAARSRSIYGALRAAGRQKQGKSRLLQVLAGLLITAALLLIIVPLLVSADDTFSAFYNHTFAQWYLSLFQPGWPVRTVCGLLAGAYLFGLVYGCVRKRHARHFKPGELHTAAQHAKVLPPTVLYVALGGVLAVYLLFIIVQGSGIFSAFRGQLSGTEVYSEYARDGFFSLIFVTVINLIILLCANLLCQKPRLQNRVLRAFNLALCGVTLLMLLSAACKMAMYINAYELTGARVLVCWTLLLLAIVFIALIVWQFKPFNLVRFCVVTGAVLFCLLVISNIDALIAAFNKSFVGLYEKNAGNAVRWYY